MQNYTLFLFYPKLAFIGDIFKYTFTSHSEERDLE